MRQTGARYRRGVVALLIGEDGQAVQRAIGHRGVPSGWALSGGRSGEEPGKERRQVGHGSRRARGGPRRPSRRALRVVAWSITPRRRRVLVDGPGHCTSRANRGPAGHRPAWPPPDRPIPGVPQAHDDVRHVAAGHIPRRAARVLEEEVLSRPPRRTPRGAWARRRFAQPAQLGGWAAVFLLDVLHALECAPGGPGWRRTCPPAGPGGSSGRAPAGERPPRWPGSRPRALRVTLFT